MNNKSKFIYIFIFVLAIFIGIYKLYISNSEFKFRTKEIYLKDLTLIKELNINSIKGYDSICISGIDDDKLYLEAYKTLGVSKNSKGVEDELLIIDLIIYDINTKNYKTIFSMNMPNYVDYVGKHRDNFIMVFTDKDKLKILMVNKNGDHRFIDTDDVRKVAVFNYKDTIGIIYDKIVNNQIESILGYVDLDNYKFIKIDKRDVKNEKLDDDIFAFNLSKDKIYYQTAIDKKFYETFYYSINNKSRSKMNFNILSNFIYEYKDMLIYNKYSKDFDSLDNMIIKHKGNNYILPYGYSWYRISAIEKEKFLIVDSSKAIYYIKPNGDVKYLAIDKFFDDKSKSWTLKLIDDSNADFYIYEYDTKILRLYKK